MHDATVYLIHADGHEASDAVQDAQVNSATAMRDDFQLSVKRIIASGSVTVLSPTCRAKTTGRMIQPAINIGVAAHVTASPGGPRYQTAISRDDRKSAKWHLAMSDVRQLIDSTKPAPRFSLALAEDC
jgi:hypothetical protein